MEKETVVLIVGHNSVSKGAYSNVLQQSEYDYNLEVANKILAMSNELKYNKETQELVSVKPMYAKNAERV